MSLKYRTEIDGLRAVAVVPVVFFHAGLSSFSGGFVGVDVFFVISGYLITKILIADIDRDRFSILTFYERRIRRIFPALFVVFLFSTIAAANLLLWDEFNEYARSLFFSTFFLANYYFMGDTGYFAGPAETKPLLHMWSLAVEEQFYIFFPFILLVCAKLARSWLVPAMVGLFITSLAGNLALTEFSADTAFYNTPTRAWELLAGSILAVYAPSKSPPVWFTNGVSAIGLAAILFAVFAFDGGTTFPGAAALVPVLGTAAILYGTSHSSGLVARILSVAPMRFIGLISYSMYLWHWPIIVFYRFWRMEELSPLETVGVIAATVVAATLSWAIVERPFRQKTILAEQRPTLIFGAGLMLVAGSIAFIVDMKDGFIGQYPNDVNAALTIRGDSWARAGCDVIYPAPVGAGRSVCRIGEGPADFAVWGDSHAGALYPAFSRAAENTGRSGYALGDSGCTPLVGVSRINAEFNFCEASARDMLRFIAENPEITDVFMVSRWTIYSEGHGSGHSVGRPVLLQDENSQQTSLAENRRVFAEGVERTAAALRDLGKNVYFVTQVPESHLDVPSAVARAKWFGRDLHDLDITADEYRERNEFVLMEFEKAVDQFEVRIIPLGERFCDEGKCSFSEGGNPKYRDSNHLGFEASEALAPYLSTFLK